MPTREVEGEPRPSATRTGASLDVEQLRPLSGEESGLFSGAPLPVVEDASRCLGAYRDVVAACRQRLRAAVASAELQPSERLQAAVFGHGGRDAVCWLAVVEAVATDEALRGRVLVRVCSCSWADDEWEPIMASYLDTLISSGRVPQGCASFTVMKFHEQCDVYTRRLQRHLEGAHVVLQCEQGMDYFVEPVTGEWLQDNYEDWMYNEACIAYAERTGALLLILQTNADLDLHAGIDGAELSEHVFGGRLQTEAFGVGLGDWGHGPQTAIGLAVAVGMAKPKRQAFRDYLNFDPENFGEVPDFYAAFTAFCASRTEAQIPVAGVLALLTALLRQGHAVPWQPAALPEPQWMLARLLLPGEAPAGHLRVVSQFRAANMHTAASFAEFFGRLMAARGGRRLRKNIVAAGARSVPNFWNQLEAAERVVTQVRDRCPGFDLWKHGADFLPAALARQASTEADAALSKAARVGQPDFTDLAPERIWFRSGHIHILDFACRFLERPPEAAGACAAEIRSGLPARPERLKPHPGQLHAAEVLVDVLVAEWTARAEVAMAPSASERKYIDGLAGLQAAQAAGRAVAGGEGGAHGPSA